MADRNEIIQFIDTFLDAEKFKDYLPVGLLAEGRSEVTKIATAVSACLDVFEDAAEWGAEMVLVHHGMFWKDSDPVLRGHLKKRVKSLLDHDLTLAGYHLPLDAHPEIGNNALFMRAMEFHDLEPFGTSMGQSIGWRGVCAPTPIESIIQRAEAFYETKPVALLHGNREVTSLAVISGGGWTRLEEAARLGIDCFVTGTADEPVYQIAREEGVHFLAFGHHATEKAGIRRLGEVVGEKFGIEARFFDADNPL